MQLYKNINGQLLHQITNFTNISLSSKTKSQLWIKQLNNYPFPNAPPHPPKRKKKKKRKKTKIHHSIINISSS